MYYLRFMLNSEKCLNCGTLFQGKFCPNCGQKAIENEDRSIWRLLTELASNMFFFDNRFWISAKYLVLKPGRMTAEYLDGKRRKFLPPVTLFLFVNVIYFFLSPLTDYSLTLYDQMHYQPYSKIATRMVEKKLEKESITLEDYSRKYDRVKNSLSQSMMILNVPLIALLLYAVTFRIRHFYYDILIFSFHYFTLFLLSICVGDILDNLISLIAKQFDLNAWGIWLFTFVLLIPILYAVFSLRVFLSVKWVWALLLGLWVFIAGGLTQAVYRVINFLSTFWAT